VYVKLVTIPKDGRIMFIRTLRKQETEFRLRCKVTNRCVKELVDSTTSGHTGRTITCIRPQHRHCWVAYKAPTTPWRWQQFGETCRGKKIWNTLIKPTSSLTHLLVISQRHSKMFGPTVKRILAYESHWTFTQSCLTLLQELRYIQSSHVLYFIQSSQ
jgi:hypothetical protein